MTHNIKSLTGLRGVAAIYVCVYHLYGESGNSFVRHGYLAVDLFFILSGFVISLAYSDLFCGDEKSGSSRKFIQHRIARIYPLYFVVTLIFCLFMAWGWQAPGQNLPLASTMIYNLLMIQSWGLAGSIAFVTWSISTEWAAYLIFPFVIRLVNKQRWYQIFAASLFSLGLLGGICFFATSGPNDYRAGPLDCSWVFSVLPVVRCWAEFYLGMAMFWLYRQRTRIEISYLEQATPLLCLSVLTLLAFWGTDLIIVSIVPAIVLGLASGRGFMQRILGSWPLFMLGELSYAVYLLHPLCLKIQNVEVQTQIHNVTIKLGPLMSAALQHVPVKVEIAIILLISAIIAHVLVEKPGRKLIRGLGKNPITGRVAHIVTDISEFPRRNFQN